MKEFFKSKLNITMLILQVIALAFLCFCSLHAVFMILAILFEGAFFIVLGVSFFMANKKLDKDIELRSMLPISEEEKNALAEKRKKSVKGNKLKGVMYMVFGVILIFLIIFQ